jgi:hypothetical protein
MLNAAANGNGVGDNGNGAGLFKMDLGPDEFLKNWVEVGDTMLLVNLAADMFGRKKVVS